jgi:hypothetical protein
MPTFTGSERVSAWVCGLCTAAFMLAIPLANAAAEDAAPAPAPAPQSQLEFNVAPFAWLPGTSGDVTVRGHQFQADKSFSDIFNKSDSLLGLAAHFEARKDKFGVFAEPIYMQLKFDQTVETVQTHLTSDLEYVEFGGFYRAFQGTVGVDGKPRDWLIDGLVGGRYTYLNQEVSVEGFPKSPSKSASWVAPFLGARPPRSGRPLSVRDSRRHRRLGAGSDFSWNTWALLGYRFPLFSAQGLVFAGYKALAQNYKSGSGADEFRWGPHRNRSNRTSTIAASSAKID